ncbi:MFS transporter [Vibrio nigripulchritudo]|uniref:MFS transporter n=1 Tax=Vibrio nigripulchritudo TaxID=28173 RepID=UPI0003B1E716|nr:MFS transporter [Vibrio nigripulchritudo]CCN70112.1 putative Arabinose efflux permease Major facilitator superfamily [Vibrio nigripulchritudo SFn118]
MDGISKMHHEPENTSALLILFAILAIFGRTATGAATVGVLILAAENGINGHQIGILAACLTAPHLLGPIWGRCLDTAKDSRRLIAFAACCYSLFLVLAALSFPALPYPALVVILIVCGGSAPFLMGGISGQLNLAFKNQQHIRRKAQGWDVACYAIGTTIGPLLVAFVAKTVNAQVAVTAIAVMPLVTAFLVMRLPKHENKVSNELAIPTVAVVAKQILQNGPLSRTLYLTMITSFSLAALPICAIFLVSDWQQEPASAATLISGYGIGNLLGSMFLIRWSNQKEADPQMTISALGVAVGILLIATATSYSLGLGSFLICGIANAFFFASTLAARTEYAPSQSASQVFMWIAAMKIGAVSVGSYLAGLLAEQSPRITLWVSLLIIISFAIISMIHRRLGKPEQVG